MNIELKLVHVLFSFLVWLLIAILFLCTQARLRLCGRSFSSSSFILPRSLSLQEFDSREAAEESVAKYHEGFFMGNKIRVEMSHGGGRTAKYNGDPGACFKCGMTGHWAR